MDAPFAWEHVVWAIEWRCPVEESYPESLKTLAVMHACVRKPQILN